MITTRDKDGVKRTIKEEYGQGPQLRISVPLADTEQRLRQLATSPYKQDTRMAIICTDDCANCIMYKLGCARRCTRFPDIVCAGCPCRASKFAGDVNEVSNDGDT